jgi:DNA-binding transcriptional LysR family regulator
MRPSREVTQRQLRAFVVLASHLHFGRAAQELYMTQPALSQSIQQLERVLNIQLFERSTKRVQLTPAGEDFLSRVQPPLQAIEDAISSTAEWSVGTRGVLRLGYLIGAALELLPRLLRAFGTRYPEVRIETLEYDFSEPAAGLADGTVRMAVVRPPLELEGLQFAKISEEPWVACVSEDHPLAARATVSMCDLLEEPIVAAPSSAGAWRDYWIGTQFRAVNAPPNITAEAATFEAEFGAVAQGRGISMTVETAARYFRRPGITFVPISDAPPSVVSLAWRPGQLTPAEMNFLAMTTELEMPEPLIS